MLFHLFEWLKAENINFPGVELFRFITFRVLLAVILSLFITTVYGKKLIRFLQKKMKCVCNTRSTTSPPSRS